MELELDPVVDVNVRSENPVPLSSTHITIQHNQQQDEAVFRLSSCFEFHFFVQRTFSVGVRVNDYNINICTSPACDHEKTGHVLGRVHFASYSPPWNKIKIYSYRVP